MPYWSMSEVQALKEMAEQGRSVGDISSALKRSPEAIRLKARRLGLAVAEGGSVTLTTTTTLPAIKPAQDLISLEEAMKTMLGALEQLKSRGMLSKLEIQRYRMIVTMSKTYMHMLDRYQRWTELEQRLVDMEARTLEHLRMLLQQSKDPAEKTRFEHQIVELEQSLAQGSKFYRPFEKKPSLVAPSLDRR